MKYYDLLKERDFEFNVIADYFGSGYIMSDGLFLSLNKNVSKFEHPGRSYHYDFDKYLFKLKRPAHYTDRLLRITDDNAIAINDGTAPEDTYTYIDLPKLELTEEQYSALSNLLSKLSQKEDKLVDVEIRFNNSRYEVFDLTKISIEAIINYIKSLYNKD